MSETITIAHLSDVHLGPLPGFSPRYWNAKRALGYLNWLHKRRFIHQRSVADRLIADMKLQQPDHVAITGDLINIGLPAEYEDAARWLASVGSPEMVSVVPGNHDIYTTLRRHPGAGLWNAYMASDDWGREHGGAPPAGFPYVRRIGPVAIVGLCSAVPTAPGSAIGRIGSVQMAQAARVLQHLDKSSVFRLVLIHHPPLPGLARPGHDLTDAHAFADALAAAGAELVIHGHNHRPMYARMMSKDRPIHIAGIASASAAATRGEDTLAQYGLLQITHQGSAWQIRLTRRGLRSAEDGVVEIDSQILSGARIDT